ncbi:methylecgonone reductase-like [Solanum stenotomum]|uniref:methylecgonone reductase-like n=1 Tax=Solanum stenotomum TaxID=172797 RepID=UPI0020D082CB|nr:methylecgonone reductase-like [Solanum stenotomum]
MGMDMKQMLVPNVNLNSGHEMPVIGMGTAPGLPQHDELVSTLIDAIEIGYRHFDTAAVYGSEEALGQAVAEAIQCGLIKSREQVFITSKLWCTETHRDLVLPALKRTLGRLNMDYLDLYLIHLPVTLKKKVNSNDDEARIDKEDIIPFDMRGTWEGMEECCRLGLAKSIGVSNFTCTKLSQILHYATIPPAVNQVEMHVAWRQEKMLEYCKEKGIHVSAWSPLGANGITPWGTHSVMESPVLKDIAIHKHKSVAQVALRWVYEQGASAIVKSFNKDRMKENLQILDWELSNEEIAQIQEIPPCTGFKVDMVLVHPNGPYKSAHQFWDGEI